MNIFSDIPNVFGPRAYREELLLQPAFELFQLNPTHLRTFFQADPIYGFTLGQLQQFIRVGFKYLEEIYLGFLITYQNLHNASRLHFAKDFRELQHGDWQDSATQIEDGVSMWFQSIPSVRPFANGTGAIGVPMALHKPGICLCATSSNKFSEI